MCANMGFAIQPGKLVPTPSATPAELKAESVSWTPGYRGRSLMAFSACLENVAGLIPRVRRINVATGVWLSRQIASSGSMPAAVASIDANHGSLSQMVPSRSTTTAAAPIR